MNKQRMYCLVLKQLSPMQKGIQSAHAIVEYGMTYSNKTYYIQWSKSDKTIIVLDGGTYSDMKECRKFLEDNKINYATFYEEDLNNLLTAIVFVADEKIWNTEKYPYYDMLSDSDSESDFYDDIERNLNIRNFIFSKRLAN